jgi:cytoskeletal protein RodZ
MTLGEKLRQAREERGISIREVAEQTRISSLYLESIENDNFKPLPGGIFNRGFVKSYAKFVGVDENEALQDYARLIAESEFRDEEHQRVYKPEVLTDDNASSSMIPTIIFAGIILALMTSGILFLVNYIQNQPDEPAGAGNAVNANITDQTTGVAPTPQGLPLFDEIRLEFKATNEKVSVEAVTDGTRSTENVEPSAIKIFTARESLSVSYYKGFAGKVELTLNGRSIEPPPAPAQRNVITLAVNKDNVRQIWEAGSFMLPDEPVKSVASPTAVAVTPTPAQTPRPAPTATPTAVATPSPVKTPAPTPSPARTPVAANTSPANTL